MTTVKTKDRNLEKWSEIVKELNIDLTKPINRIKPEQIKDICGVEARIMAKIDSLKDLPQVFKENNIIILPVSSREYILIKGISYHFIEEIPKAAVIHYSEIPIDFSKASESYYLDYAFASGMISRLSKFQFDQLHLTGRGRRFVKFDFILNKHKISVNGAQIEIDGQYENGKEILIFEAKIRPIESFNIRQLYYPFRALQNKKKKVRIFFFNFDRKNQLFKFWEYTFDPIDNLDAITIIDYYVFKLKVTKKSKLIRVSPKPEKIDIPQADDIEKVFLIVEKVDQGHNDAKKISQILQFVPRQSSYYRHAGELLGIIKLQEHKYEITQAGYSYLKATEQDRKNIIFRLMLEFPIINEIFSSLISNRVKEFNREDIADLLNKKSSLQGSTLTRRTRTIISWFRWIEQNTAFVKVIDRKRIISNMGKALIEKPISEKIKNRENPNLEFKSSFRYDIKLERPNPKVLEKTIIKTIAAFMNSQGGDLIIGVDDDGNVLGLENDYRLLKKKNSDWFELELRQVIDKYIRNRVANEFVKLNFHTIDGKDVCEVKVSQTQVPIFVTGADGKHECYVRVGNSSKPYNYEEFYQYCNRHFISKL